MIVNDNIRLEPTDPAHAAAVFALIDRDRPHLKQWLTWVDHMHSEERFRQFAEGSRLRIAEGSELSYFIFWQGKPAGRVGLYEINGANRSGAVGYWLGAEFQGRGIIRSCCRALIGEAFEKREFNRIELKCATGNLRSRSVAEGLGFSQEGVIRQGEWLNGTFTDLALYSLLAEEWRKAE